MSKEQHMDMQEEEIANQQTGLSLELSGLIKLSKKELSEKVSEALDLIKDGFIEPIDAYIFAKKGEKMFKDLVEQVKPLAEERSYEKGFAKFGAVITESTLGAKTDYSGCNDLQWNELNAQMLELKAKVTERETFLKGVATQMDLINRETGEVYTISPPIKTGKAGITVTIK